MLAGSYPFRLQAFTRNLLQELDFHADFQIVEFGIGQVVPVKIEFRPVGSLDKSVTIVEQLRDAAVQGYLMHLYIAPLLTDKVLQLSRRRFEGIANDDVDILMTVDAIDDDLGSGYGQVNVNFVHAALRMVLAGHADGHLAMHDMITELVKLFSTLADLRFNGIGARDIEKADLQGDFHDDTFLSFKVGAAHSGVRHGAIGG